MHRRADLGYSLRRAEQESILSIAADEPAVATAHYELCLLHSAKALEALTAAAQRSGIPLRD